MHRHSVLRNLTLIAVAAMSCQNARKNRLLRDWVLFANVCLSWFRAFGVGYATVRDWISVLVPAGFKAQLGATLDAIVAAKPNRTAFVLIPIPRGMDVSDARARAQPYPLFGKSKEAASYTLQQLMRVTIPVRRT